MTTDIHDDSSAGQPLGLGSTEGLGVIAARARWPWVWRLIPVSLPEEYEHHGTIMDPVSGRPGGIQQMPTLKPRPLASSACPLCVLEWPHQHGLEELAELRRMAAYLESKLGLTPNVRAKPQP
jgi:hypothetical protein